MKTFYDAKRTTSATIDLADWVEPEQLFDDALRASCEVFLATDHLRGLFGGDHKDMTDVDKAIDIARRKGDRIYYIEIYSHGDFIVRIAKRYEPMSRFDSGLNGVLIVHAEAWKRLVNPVFTQGCVDREMRRLSERATAWLNGEIFEIFSDGVASGPFFSEEEAETVLRAEYPLLRFQDDDFICERSYRLKPELRAAA